MEHGKSAVVVDSTRRAYTRRFHNLYLFITERCQLRCGHCYMGERLERGLMMDFDRAASILSFFRNMGSDYVTFVGGEPTLHPDLPRLVEYAVQAGYLKVMVDTNALLVDNILRIAPDSLYYVRVSLDGATPESHDRVRGAGSFWKVVDSMRQLKSAGYDVRITFTVFRFNMGEINSLLDLAEELGVEVVNLHTFSEEGCGRDKTGWSLSPQEWSCLCQELPVLRATKKVEMRYPPTWASPESVSRYVDQGFNGCMGCSLDRISVFPDGRCYVCPLLFDTQAHFALLNEEGLKLNSGKNEYEMFVAAALGADSVPTMGCPAESFLSADLSAVKESGLISMCRLWRVEA